jgi:hypothetical protein
MNDVKDYHKLGCLEMYEQVQSPTGLSEFSGVIYSYNRRSMVLDTSQFPTQINRSVLSLLQRFSPFFVK